MPWIALEMQQQQIQATAEEERLKREYEEGRDEKDRQKDILIAEIKAAGYGSMVDINQNQMSDYKDAMDSIRKTEQYKTQTQIAQEKETTKQLQNNERNAIEREKLQVQRDVAQTQLEIARENKNKYDREKPKKDKK